MPGSEIITIQFGTHSNHVGAHFFNLEEAGFSYNPSFIPDIDNDILFREASTTTGTRGYTPRLILVDSTSSIGTDVSLTGEAFQEIPQDDLQRMAGNSTLDIQDRREEIKKEDNLVSYEDAPVKYWSDYISVPINPRTYNILNPLILPDEIQEEGFYPFGKNIWERCDFQDDFVDSIRYHMEDCDNLQGFHVLIDSQTVYSGISSSCLEHLRDEYGKKCILAFPLFYNRVDKDISNLIPEKLNTMHTLAKCSELSDIIVPLSTDLKTFDHSKRDFSFTLKDDRFNNSSVLAMGMELMTLPYRSRQRLTTMDIMANYLCVYGRSVISASIHAPWKLQNYLYDELSNLKLTPITPRIQSQVSDLQFISSKFNVQSLIRDSDKKTIQEENPSLNFSTPNEVIEYYFYTQNIKTKASNINEKVRLPKKFPDLFGEFKEKVRYGKLRDMEAVATLRQTIETLDFLKEIKPDRKWVRKSVPRLARVDLKVSDIECEIETLSKLISNYEPDEFL